MDAIILEHLSKIYKNGRGVVDLSLTIKKGQIVGLLGPNGSGKTTTMKMITGMIRPDSGTVKLLGEDPEHNIEKAMEQVACLIENPSYYPYLTARENLEIIGKLYFTCSSARIDHILDQVGLLSFAKEKVSKFSLGMKQRLGLSMVLLSEPEILILDEPSNGLDIEGMADVRELILKQAEKGKTILISSHLAAELEQICSHVAIMREGVLLHYAEVSQVLQEYNSIQNYYLSVVDRKREGKA